MKIEYSYINFPENLDPNNRTGHFVKVTNVKVEDNTIKYELTYLGENKNGYS